MGEYFDYPKGFPSDVILREKTVEALKVLGGERTPQEIKEYITKTLNLTEEVLNFENSDGLTMLIDYRLRWARTFLKNEGEIVNVRRGYWKSI